MELEIVESLINKIHLLEHALNSGLATALAAEVIEAIKYATSDAPYSEPCTGHITDPIIRSLGVPLVTGDALFHLILLLDLINLLQLLKLAQIL